ncbi:MAG: flagellar protein FlgN [Pirellulales bacterium]
MNDNWETDIADLLTELASVQGALLDLLTEKREILASGDHDALVATAQREQVLVDRLTACHQRRQQLLARAAADGLPSDSIRSLSSSLPTESRGRVQSGIEQAAERGRFLQHQCLTNWVLVQRTLIHLSQMIEIIATGGRPMPTYGNGSDRTASGALVDRAV